jgi:hypothetical protein
MRGAPQPTGQDVRRGEEAALMVHDFSKQPTGSAADEFRTWIEHETIDTLRRSYGNAEATKTAIFLFVNRAYEAHMPDPEIAELFGKCIVRAGFREEDEEPAFDWLDFFGQLAAKVHGRG